MTVVVAYVPDLMDRSRFSAAAVEVHFVAAPTDLARVAAEHEADVVVVDLGRPGVLEVVGSGEVAARVVGFGSHVDADVLDAARAAGVAEVLPRSRFFATLPTLLA